MPKRNVLQNLKKQTGVQKKVFVYTAKPVKCTFTAMLAKM